MGGVRHFLKKHVLWVGFLAVLLPLAILLGLQYSWLARLQETSAIAQKAWLKNYVETVSNRIEKSYKLEADRALYIPEDLFRYPRKKLGHHWKKKEVVGAKALFVARYSDGQQWEDLVIYDPVTETIGKPKDRSMWNAINVALSPWKILADDAAPLQSHALTVDEKDPENRIILSPISDDGCRIIGVAGMVVDSDFFEEEVLPLAVEESLPKSMDERSMENLLLTVRDGKDRVVLGSAEDDAELGEDAVTRALSFIFTDWTLSLGSRYETPEHLAKRNFLLNISLSVLLTAALLGGVIVTLRAASREVHLSRMKSDFVSNVSHELRTPLASIRVFGEFLRLGRVRDDGKSREYGEYIETESRRLTQLIDNILDFSKIESGAKTYDFEPTDIEDALVDVLRSLAVSLKHRGFHLSFVPAPVDLPPVFVDPDAIAQALANLVDNAVKYSGESTEVEVALGRDGNEVILSVRDAGIGISRDEQEKIFERFHRVGTGLVHDVKGSGLGLSIVNHIVQAHNGTVSVDSEVGRGSTFTIRLPISPSAAADDARDIVPPPGVESAESLGKS